MLEYRAYKIGPDCHFFEAIPFVCADDAEAIEKAKRLVNSNDVELWERARKIASFKHECQKSVGSIKIHDRRVISKPVA